MSGARLLIEPVNQVADPPTELFAAQADRAGQLVFSAQLSPIRKGLPAKLGRLVRREDTLPCDFRGKAIKNV